MPYFLYLFVIGMGNWICQNDVFYEMLQHWAKRMGNKNINLKTSKGTNMSTVGVDIGDWVYEKKVRNQSSHGAVVFRQVYSHVQACGPQVWFYPKI